MAESRQDAREAPFSGDFQCHSRHASRGKDEGFASLCTETRRTPDYLTVEGVSSEPVSAGNSLMNRENTGNSVISAFERLIRAANCGLKPRGYAAIPWRQEQGNSAGPAGKSGPRSGNAIAGRPSTNHARTWSDAVPRPLRRAAGNRGSDFTSGPVLASASRSS